MNAQASTRLEPFSESFEQFGALCIRRRSEGPEILMITTRRTRRWMIPKGWPIDGLSPRQVAEREAWEEAGAIGKAKRKLFGKFRYMKVLPDGSEIEPLVAVYLLIVRKRKKRFPERTERRVSWMKPGEAALRVRDPDLRKLIHAVERRFGAARDRAAV